MAHARRGLGRTTEGVPEQQPAKQERPARPQRFGRTGENEECDGTPEAHEPRRARLIHVRFSGQKNQRKHGSRDQGGGVLEMAEQIRSIGKAECAHEGPGRARPQSLQVEVGEDPGERDGDEDKGLERGEGLEPRNQEG